MFIFSSYMVANARSENLTFVLHYNVPVHLLSSFYFWSHSEGLNQEL